MKFWYKSLSVFFGAMFIFNDELYQIETRGQNQLHLFPTRTVSARNVLRHHVPDLLQEYPRAITQRANTHSIESFVTLLKAYIIESYSYVCTDINCYSCRRNVMWLSLFQIYVPASDELYFPIVTYMWHMVKYLYVWLFGWFDGQTLLSLKWLALLAIICSPQGGLYVSGQAWPS